MKAPIYKRHPADRTAPSKSLTLPHGRATEHSDAQVSSPRVSKGCAACNDLQDFDGALPLTVRQSRNKRFYFPAIDHSWREASDSTSQPVEVTRTFSST